ncbi:hypothetical protein [Streptomyces sp. NPDC057494]|uniref:hypothetical protein n=1 Tax=Streptomyces sp. NPDC057494 TaxID=3346148 RepID=UPI0036B315A2
MTGEHRATTSRITDALLQTPEPRALPAVETTDLPAVELTDLPAVETTTRLRPITLTDPPPAPEPGPVPPARPAPTPSPAPAPGMPARPAAGMPAAGSPVRPTPPSPQPGPVLPAPPAARTTPQPGPVLPARPSPTATPPSAPAATTAVPPAPPRPTAARAGSPGAPARPVAAPADPSRAAAPTAGPTPLPPRPTGAPAGGSAGPGRPTGRVDAPTRPGAAPAWPGAAQDEPTGRPVRPAGPTGVGARPTAAPGRPVVAGRPAPHAVGPGSPRSQALPPYALSYGPGALPPEMPVEVTTRLRPVRERRPGRTFAVAACAVLGFGLVGGALAGVWLAAAEPGKPAEPVGYTEAKDLWHDVPVDALFPRTLAGPGAGPGGAARAWTRIVVAPDAPCTSAVLTKGLLATVEPLGCERVLRATYTDATASSVITVGLVFTRADAATQRTLGPDLTTRLGADVPPALAGPGTVAARFGAPQRAAWWLNAPADLPVVVTAVSGFADGRTVDGGPVPADRAMAPNRTDATSQSGLGHEAKGITERLVRLLRTAATTAAKENAR